MRPTSQPTLKRMGPFFPKNNQYNFFHKKSFGPILSFYANITLYKISQKFHVLILCKTCKLHFGPIFGLFSLKKLKNKISFKLTLSLYAVVTSCRNLEKFHVLTFDKTWKTYFSNNKFLKTQVFRKISHLGVILTTNGHKTSGLVGPQTP